jgi:tRNA(fMet)-specific endonuclease VapC
VIEYSLDANACIGLINGAPARLRARFDEVVREDCVVCVSTVVLHELWFGVEKSGRRAHNTERLRTFLAGVVEVLEFDDADARAAGSVRAELARVGTPIGAYDVLIAGQAIRHGLTLVTANVREFDRIDGLMWEDWAA